MKNKLFRFVPLLVIATLMVALLTPGLAYAQGEQPQDPPSASEGSGATEEAPPAEEPPVEETPPAEESSPEGVTTEEAPTEEPPVEEPPATEPLVSEGVQALNEGDAVLVDASGQPVPLASELAAEALAGTDAHFSCGTDDKDGTNDGTCHYSTIMGAVGDFKARSGAGNIFIGSGQFDEKVIIAPAEDIGLTGLEGQGSGSTQINGGIQVNSLSNFLLQGVTVYGDVAVYSDRDVTVQDVHVIAPDDEEAGSGTLIAGAFGSVYLEDVHVTDGGGALVCSGTNNCLGFLTDSAPGAGRETSEPGEVIVKNSTFNRNAADESGISVIWGTGLTVLSFGDVTLDHVKTQDNAGSGLNITTNSGNVSLAYVTSTGNYALTMPVSNSIMINGSSTDVQEGGEPIPETGHVIIANSTFSRNYGGLGLQVVAPAGVWITNSHFDQNSVESPNLEGDSSLYGEYESSSLEGGLSVDAMAITLSGVTANGNVGVGALLSASSGDPETVAQTSGTSPSTVNIWNSSFNSNTLNGLEIASGVVAVGNSRACWNGDTDYIGPEPVSGELGPCVQEDEQGGNPPPQWLGVGPQIINVFFGGGSGPFNLDRTRDLIYKLWEKQPVETPDNHLLAQVGLPAYAVPLGGSTGFSPLEQSALPGGLPQGMTFVGPAISFNVSDANGNALDTLDGRAGVSFFLPQDYTVPEGQELVILFFDPDSNSWQEIPVQVVGDKVFAYVDRPGTYTLALKPKA